LRGRPEGEIEKGVTTRAEGRVPVVLCFKPP